MRLVWLPGYVVCLALVVVCLILNFITTFVHSLAQSGAEYYEKKLRAQRGRA